MLNIVDITSAILFWLNFDVWLLGCGHGWFDSLLKGEKKKKRKERRKGICKKILNILNKIVKIW